MLRHYAACVISLALFTTTLTEEAFAWTKMPHWENTVPAVEALFVQGDAAFNKSQYNRAAVCYTKIIRVTQRWGTYTPEFGSAMFKLGLVYLNQGDIHRADETFKKLIVLTSLNQGEKNRDVGLEAKILGDISVRLGRQQEAEQYYEQALNVFKTALGPKDPELANTLLTVAAFYKKTGRPEKAYELEAQADAILDPTSI